MSHNRAYMSGLLTPPCTSSPVAVVVASHNEHKVREMAAILRRLQHRTASQNVSQNTASAPAIALLALTDLSASDRPPEVDETGQTFAENALLKARSVARHLDAIAWRNPACRGVLADDSGLCVPALGGAPGVCSRRYAGPQASDAENNAKLLNALAGYSGDARRAYFACTLAWVPLPNSEAQTAPKLATRQTAFPSSEQIFTGECHGRIGEVPIGHAGFGYDPLFIPRGHTRTLAAMPASEKDSISHRRRALESFLAAWLRP